MRRWPVLALVVVLVAGGLGLASGAVPCDAFQAQPTCYVAMRPGPAENTVDLVEVGGAPSYVPAGELLLTTVAVDDELGFREWLRASTSTAVTVVPRDQLYPPGVDPDEVAEHNAILMADSQLTATLTALEELGYDIAGRGALVAGVTDDAVTDELREGDVILAVDGDEVTESVDVVDAVRTRSPGDRVVLRVVRDGESYDLPVTLGRSPDEPDRAYIGVLVTTEVDLPVDVDIDAGVIGGPSAGLMFALTIVELLDADDLTGGAVIAGTGTVDREGTVGAVGGVRQKAIAASVRGNGKRPATVFLVPRANVDDVRDAPLGGDMLVVPVDTLADALEALRDLKEGREPRDALALAGR